MTSDELAIERKNKHLQTEREDRVKERWCRNLHKYFSFLPLFSVTTQTSLAELVVLVCFTGNKVFSVLKRR